MVIGVGKHYSILVSSEEDVVGTLVQPVRSKKLRSGDRVFFEPQGLFVELEDEEEPVIYAFVTEDDIIGLIGV